MEKFREKAKLMDKAYFWARNVNRTNVGENGL